MGVDVVVPLRDRRGEPLLVDRGWLADRRPAARHRTRSRPRRPARCTVTGYVRVDATGDSAKVTDRVDAVDLERADRRRPSDRETYGGFVELASEDPSPDTPLEPAELPDLSNGPHFFYGLQWWFFGLLALFGFCYLAYDEWRGAARAGRGGQHTGARSMPPSTGSIDTGDERRTAGESRNAAARPNSSGSPVATERDRARAPRPAPPRRRPSSASSSATRSVPTRPGSSPLTRTPADPARRRGSWRPSRGRAGARWRSPCRRWARAPTTTARRRPTRRPAARRRPRGPSGPRRGTPTRTPWSTPRR